MVFADKAQILAEIAKIANAELHSLNLKIGSMKFREAQHINLLYLLRFVL